MVLGWVRFGFSDLFGVRLGWFWVPVWLTVCDCGVSLALMLLFVCLWVLVVVAILLFGFVDLMLF